MWTGWFRLTIGVSCDFTVTVNVNAFDTQGCSTRVAAFSDGEGSSDGGGPGYE